MKFNDTYITGWSNLTKVKTKLILPSSIDEILKIIYYAKNNNYKIAIRGLGCSFGDQSYLENEITIDLSNFNKILEYNKEKKYILVEAGISLLEIYNKIINDNFILESTPGGLQVSVGGAVANNIHGKDCFKNGYFENNVISIKYIDSAGNIDEVTKNNTNKFENIFGSMGLFCVILEVKIKLKKVKSLELETITKKVYSIEEMVESFDDKNLYRYDYAIGWVDCFDKKNIGRGLFRKAKFADIKNKFYIEKMKKNKKFLFLHKDLMITFLSFIYNRNIFKIVNSLIFNFYYKNKEKLLFNKFIWMDNNYIPDYPLIFSKKGFLTLQPFIPLKNAASNIKSILKLCHDHKFEGIFCPIKKYKKQNNSLCFGDDGFSIVLDVPLKNKDTKEIKSFLNNFFNLLDTFNGNVYLTKDFYMNKSHLDKISFNKKKLYKLKGQFDNSNLFSSNQYKRLFQK